MNYARTLLITVFAGGLCCTTLLSQTAPTKDASAGSPSQLPVYFPAGSIWTTDATNAPVDPHSSEIINWLDKAGGWGTGKMHVDFAIRVLHTAPDTPWVPFRRGKDFYEADSDKVSTVPLPVGGGMEGESGYTCPAEREDCHLIVVDDSQKKLYEAYEANLVKGKLTATFIAVWDLNRVYPITGRGEQCTSADAAGFPIAPLLFNADELKAGTINHAIRFILPNDRIREGEFVPPATHAGGPKGPDSAPPYGAHLRLKASYDVSQLKPAAQVVARAMQKYGMYLADGGDVALTAQNDADTRTKYTDVNFTPQDLAPLKVTDFEILPMTRRIDVTYNCVRNR